MPPVGTFRATKGLFATMVIEGRKYPASFRVVPHLTEEVIIGHEFMQLWRAKIDMNSLVITLTPKDLKMKAMRAAPRRRR